VLGLGTRTLTIAALCCLCFFPLFFRWYDVDVDDLLHSALFFILLLHRRTGMFCGGLGGGKGGRIGGRRELGVLRGGQISTGAWDLDTLHALCLPCADVSYVDCALCGVFLSLHGIIGLRPLHLCRSVLCGLPTCRTTCESHAAA